MKALCQSIAAFALTALLASPALAQGFGGRGGMGSPVMLLGNRSVQEELKLDEKQIEQARKLGEDTREKMREAFQSARDLEGDARREKMQEAMRGVNESNRQALRSLLKPEQRLRLHQIWLQQRGGMAFTDPDVQKQLKFTDAQKEKVKTLAEEMQGKVREIMQEAAGDREAAREKMLPLNKEYNEKLKAELNDEQAKSYKQMLGTPFELARDRN